MIEHVINSAVFSKYNNAPVECEYKRTVNETESYPMHLNSKCEIYIFISGEADYIVENRCYCLKPYDVVIISPYEPHMPIIKNYELYERLYMLIPVDTFSFMKNDPLKVLLAENAVGKNLISLSIREKEIIKQITELFKKRTISDSVILQSAVTGIIGLLSESTFDKHEFGNRADVPPLISDILKYIDRSFTGDINVEAVAAHFHISVSYLSRSFKKSINFGIKQYIMMRKIGYAKKLLDSGKTVTEACFESGFCDCSYFIKVFKRYTGITPYKYGKR